MPTHDEIFQKVQATLVDALGVDEDDVTRDATLQGDLGAESIDFLDIVFRLERNFGIKIPRGELFPENVVADPDMVQDGKLTAKGLDELKTRMPYADLTRVRGRPRRREDRRPVHGRHAGPVRPEQARGLSDGRASVPATAVGQRSRPAGRARSTRSSVRTLPDGDRSTADSADVPTMRWIWIDKFLEFRSGEFARAVKNLTLAEEHLHDHFPGYPVMPASLIIEGLAQTGGILVGEAGGFAEKVVLAKIPRAEFFGVACAGDQLDLRGDPDRPAEPKGRSSRPRRSSKASCSPTSRSSSPTWTTRGPTRSSARRTSCSPSNCWASSTWPRPRAGPGDRQRRAGQRTAARRSSAVGGLIEACQSVDPDVAGVPCEAPDEATSPPASAPSSPTHHGGDRRVPHASFRTPCGHHRSGPRQPPRDRSRSRTGPRWPRGGVASRRLTRLPGRRTCPTTSAARSPTSTPRLA